MIDNTFACSRCDRPVPTECIGQLFHLHYRRVSISMEISHEEADAAAPPPFLLMMGEGSLERTSGPLWVPDLATQAERMPVDKLTRCDHTS